MRLSIQNLGKIDHADIELNGITVIAGPNDTGKSTIGKTLYAMFHSFQHLSKIVMLQRRQSIANYILGVAETYEEFHYDKPYLMQRMQVIQELAQAFPDTLTVDGCLNTGNAYIERMYHFSLQTEKKAWQALQGKMAQILAIRDEELSQQYVGQTFNHIFVQQVNSLLNNQLAKVELRLQKQFLRVTFLQNTCSSLENGVNLTQHAIYIDNPYVVDHLNRLGHVDKDTMQAYLSTLLRQPEEADAVEDILRNKTLHTVMNLLEQTVPGDIRLDDNGTNVYNRNYRAPITIDNLSTGMKAFAIMKILLQNHQIRERDVLILDEPEIHLHPEWQLLYAKFLVLLQRAFNLTILLTSHSPYFLNAIEVYVKKYGIEQQTTYYLSSVQPNGVVFEDVTGHVDKIYKSLARPFSHLAEMEAELEQDAE